MKRKNKMEEDEKELAIQGQKINEYVAQKILESSIGDYIKKAIKDKIEEFTRYNNPLKEIIDKQMNLIIIETLKEEKYVKAVKDSVKRAFNDEKINSLVEDFCKRLKVSDRY